MPDLHEVTLTANLRANDQYGFMVPVLASTLRLIPLVSRIVDATRRDDPALEQGFRIVACSSDLWLYQLALRAGLATIRARAGKQELEA